MILVLQTNLSGHLYAWLTDRRGRIVAKGSQAVAWHGSSKILPMVDRLVRQIKKKINALSRVIIVRGPGPFTAVRSGLVVANGLGYSLGIPVSGIVTKHLLTEDRVTALATQPQPRRTIVVRPWYGRQPNITKPKRGRLKKG